MTPAAILDLLVAVAQAFGLVAGDVLAFATGKHPELQSAALPTLDTVETARAEAVARTVQT